MSREIRAVSRGVISRCAYVRMQRHAESTLTLRDPHEYMLNVSHPGSVSVGFHVGY